jgi:hypothetical protein
MKGSSNQTHRGASGNISEFATRFVDGRLAGFKKDMSICLTAIDSPTGTGKTHAYFPALAACCGMLEYMTALDQGNVNNIGWRQVADWAAKYLPQPDYDQDTIRILFEAFRHSVAHRGIASGVWVEKIQGRAPRRVTWRVHANSRQPACRLVAEEGRLKRDPPWACKYTHRMHIHLKKLELDLRLGAEKYRETVRVDAKVQSRFEACMTQLYPK